jgi:tight adherence protein C
VDQAQDEEAAEGHHPSLARYDRHPLHLGRDRLGFDAAISRICRKAQNPLTAEFDKYLTEIRLGKARREALRQLQARTGVEDLTTFIGAVIQADQLGMSMDKILRVQSEQLRVKRRRRAEQLAQRAPLTMLFLVMLFIFLSIFVVILRPTIRQLMHIGG